MSQGISDKYLVSGTDEDVVLNYSTLAERAKDKRFGLMEQQYVILDTETTGLKVEEEELLEIAAAIMDGPEVIDTFQTFVNPGKPIPEFITELTSITEEDVKGAPYPEEAVAQLEEFVGQRNIVAHNARFDYGFIRRYSSDESPLSSRECWIDSLGLSRIAMPRLVAHDQTTMCDAFGIERGGHRAIGDVLALCRLWRIMLVALDDMPKDLLTFMGEIAPGAKWPMRPIINKIAAGDGAAGSGDGGSRRFSMHTFRDKRIQKDAEAGKYFIDPSNNGADLKPIDREEITWAFSKDGVVGHMYPKFEPREGQVEFALNVAEAFHTSTHRVIEAGTGVGKSISYLLPAVMFAKRNHVRVGVATKTNTLLDQLVFKELPLLRKALNETLDLDFSYISLKGYDHYPCLRKVMRYARDMDESTSEYDIVTVCTVLSSVAQAVWGDLDSLSISLSKYARPNIVCSADECMHGKCSYFPKRCLLHGARKKANDSEIIVTNHALMFRDFAMDKAILPPVRYWVVDEAHGIEEEARGQFSFTVDASDLNGLLKTLGSASGPIKQMQQEALLLEGGSAMMGSTTAVLQDIPSVQSLTDSFFGFVKGLGNLVSKSSYATQEIWINQERRETEEWQTVETAGSSLLSSLDKLIRDCRGVVSMAEEFEELAEYATEVSNTMAMLGGALESLSLILDGTNHDYYYYAKVHSDANKSAESLSAALVDLGGELSERFFPEANSVILTSATIAVGESFDYFSHRVGRDRLESTLWESCKLQPSEGFYDNMHTIVVKDLPEPRSPGYFEELEALILNVHMGLGGGVLTLFTNRREMLQVYEDINPTLKQAGIELLCQSAGKSKRVLRDEFMNKEDSCLFAMKSFWEGFDAPGRTLRCVLLPKLPFSRPDDPLYQERSSRQNDAWKSYVLPQAIIDTKQAAGRLIRSKEDSGFLILGDRRLQTKWYGKMFLKAFPKESQRVVTIADIESVLEQSNL